MDFVITAELASKGDHRYGGMVEYGVVARAGDHQVVAAVDGHRHTVLIEREEQGVVGTVVERDVASEQGSEVRCECRAIAEVRHGVSPDPGCRPRGGAGDQDGGF